MKQVKSIIITILSVSLLVGIAIGQGRSRQKSKSARPAVAVAPTPSPTPSPTPTPSNAKQSVSIKMKNGDLIIANLLRRDSQTIQVDLTEGPRTIKLSDIETLTYLPKEKSSSDTPPKETPVAKTTEQTVANQPAPAPDTTMANGRKAYAALRKLATAAQIGSPYPQYSSLLIETKASVDESLSAIPENAVKAELAAAMEAYVDAGQALAAAQTIAVPPGQAVLVLLVASEPGATLMKKYGIKPAANALGQEDRLMLDVTLSAIWTAANARLANVGPMLKM